MSLLIHLREPAPTTPEILRTGLNTIIAGVSAVTLGGLLFGGISPTLGGLMALSIGSLVSFAILLSPPQGTRSTCAAVIGSGVGIAALATGLMELPLLILQLAIASCGVMTVWIAILQQRQLLTEDRIARKLQDQLLRAHALQRTNLRLSGAAHDINNLLTVVSCSAELMQMRPGMPDNAQRDLDRLVQATEHARALGQEMLSDCREQANTPSLIDLTALIHALAPLLEAMLDTRARLHLHLPAAPACTLATTQNIEQILINLIANARDAFDRPGAVSITLIPDDAHVTLRVADTGVGMDTHTKHRALEAFFTTKASGDGMGLHTVHTIVTDLGGHINIDSLPDRGTTIEIRLPRANADENISAA